MNSQISQEKLSELTTLHEQWKSHPITKQFSVLLGDIEEELVNFMAMRSTDRQTTDSEIRQWAAQIQQIKRTKALIYDTRKFIDKSASHSNNHANS